MITREEEIPTKQEDGTNLVKISNRQSSSKTWLGLQDSRIVRVSRSFGGKDRHSKVFTVRGLRDRRVRLSVQTAIQLYDLQDRLGLNQPSKAVDWLLNVSQHEIDLLPPLQMPPENFVRYQPVAVSHEVPPSQAPLTSHFGTSVENIRSTDAPSLALLSNNGTVKSTHTVVGEDQGMLSTSTYWRSNASLMAKSEEIRRETVSDEGDRYKRNEQENQEAIAVQSAQELPFNSLHKPSHSSLPCFLNSAMPYTSYYQLEMPSNPSASHLTGHGYPSQMGETYNSSTTPTQSPLSLPYGSQLLLYPSETIPSNFPPYVGASVDYDLKQINHYQMLSSTSQNVQPNSITASRYAISPSIRPSHVSIAPKHHLSQNNKESP